jgi:LmbE family N-acetylglucosaminyl deacetylase
VRGDSVNKATRFDRYFQQVRLDEERTSIMKRSKRIVAFSPHPDDMEIVAGGFLASAVDRGAQVKVEVVSDDRMSFTSMEKVRSMEEIVSIRKREEIQAMNVLGIKDIEFLEYIDSQVPEPSALLRDFVRVMRSYEPDLAVTVDPFLPYEAHPDHINTGRGVMQAVLFHGYPYIVKDAKVQSKPPALALGASSSPNAIVCIDGVIDRKIESILAHASQFPDREEMEKRVRDISSLFGKVANCVYGEPFKVLLPDETHLDVFASF